MIEKIKFEETSSDVFRDTINQLVDAVNELRAGDTDEFQHIANRIGFYSPNFAFSENLFCSDKEELTND